jgi:hypothetical protein
LAGQGIPRGFEAAGLLDQLMGGQIVAESPVNTDTESHTISRAFFNRVSPEAYAALAVNHIKYSDLFSDIKKGETLAVNSSRTEFDYRFDILITWGILSKHIHPEGRQRIDRGADATLETRIHNEVTNLKDYISSTVQITQLIPYQAGILVEDDVTVAANKKFFKADLVKKRLRAVFLALPGAFRRELQGDY